MDAGCEGQENKKNHPTHSKRQQNRKVKGELQKVNHVDRLKQYVSALMALYDQHSLCIPLPDMIDGKVWSSRNYGQDKKRQRKKRELDFLREMRIPQLEAGLRERGLTLGKIATGSEDEEDTDNSVDLSDLNMY